MNPRLSISRELRKPSHAPSHLDSWVERLEFVAGVFEPHLPIDAALDALTSVDQAASSAWILGIGQRAEAAA